MKKNQKTLEMNVLSDRITILVDRLEYDFGEVKLVINGIVKRYYIAVLSSPAGNFRWCYLL